MAIRTNIKVNCREGGFGFCSESKCKERLYKAQIWVRSMRATLVQENLNRSPVDKTEYIFGGFT